MMPSFKLSSLPLAFCLLGCLYGLAQSPTDQKKTEQSAKLKSLIDSRQYRFGAQSATTLKGKTIQLSIGYGLKVNKDSLSVDLPYYGRAFTANIGNTDGGFKFKSTHFTYTAEAAKKGGWDITIKPSKETKVNIIYLSVSESGYASVRINSNDKEPISYYGTVTDNSKP